VKGGGQECKLGIAALETDGELLEATLVCRVDNLLLVLTQLRKYCQALGSGSTTSYLDSAPASPKSSQLASQALSVGGRVGLYTRLVRCTTSSLNVSLDCRARARSAFPLRR